MREFKAAPIPSEISMDGFQLVPGQFFSRQLEPSMTIWYNSVAFNTTSYAALNDCASIHILVNSREKKIAVTPCHSTDKDAIAWHKTGKNRKYRKIECSKFAHQLFDIWNFNKELHYRVNGTLLNVNEKILLLFDFSTPEAWRGLKMTNALEQ